FMLSRNEPAPSTGTREPGPRRGFVVQLDPTTGERLTAIDAFTPVPGGRSLLVSNHGIVVGQGGVWLARAPDFLVHVDPRSGEVRSRLILERGSFSFSV